MLTPNPTGSKGTTMKSLAFLALALVPAAAWSVDPTSAFDFSGNLDPFINNGHSGTLLHLNGGGNPSATSSTFATATVGSTTKQVLNFSKGDTLFALHGIGANDAHNNGGAYVNNYTIVMDVKFDQGADGTYNSLFNTNATNSNDGDSFLLWGSSTAGIGIAGDYQGAVTANVWHRMAIAVDIFPDGTELSYYMDGALIGKHVGRPGGDPTDGRYALYTYNDGDTDSDGVYIFGDEDGDNGSGQISQLAFYGSTLTGDQVKALGGVGQPVPEPASMAALALGATALLRRRKK